ncbi:unnamed protein product, partial [Porites lobata]
MPDDKIKAKLDKYTRPENINGLRTPKVNPLNWSQLSATMKAQDARSQKGQNALIGSVIAMTKATDLVLAKYSQDKDLITLLTDAIAMALQFNHEVNHSRRVAMKKELHKDYAALCNSSTVEGSSEQLFGDLSKLAKDISEANKLTKKVRPSHSTNSREKGRRDESAAMKMPEPPPQMFTENQTRQSARNTHCSSLANTAVVPSPATIPVRSTLDSASTPGPSETPLTQSTPPTAQETPPNGMSCVRGAFSRYNFSEEVTDVLMASWRSGTQKQYQTYLNKWMAFCGERRIAYYSPPLNEALQFLVRLFNQGLSYSALNTARSALSAIIITEGGESFGTN